MSTDIGVPSRSIDLEDQKSLVNTKGATMVVF